VDGDVTLRVVDDGIGMQDPKNVRRGMGLQTMYRRATLIGGNLQIERGKMGGTEISCRIRSEQT
jgi:signal transduction histidine kinase